VIEKVSGEPYAAFVQKNLFDTVGMSDSGYVGGETFAVGDTHYTFVKQGGAVTGLRADQVYGLYVMQKQSARAPIDIRCMRPHPMHRHSMGAPWPGRRSTSCRGRSTC